MSATEKTFTNNNPPTVEDADLNGFKAENNNLILGSGQALNTGDNQQTHKAVAAYAGNGDFFDETGAADAYVLAALGAKVAPPAYTEGMRVRFVAGNTNTGPSTINVSGLGVKNLTQPGGVNLDAGFILAGDRLLAEYDSANGRFEVRTVLQATESRLGGAEIATAAEVLAAADLLKIVTAGRLGNHPGVAKAVVNFNGVGGVVVNKSHNVSSVVRNSLGDYTINFATPLADADYSVVLTSVSTSPTTITSWPAIKGTPAGGATLKTVNALQIVFAGTAGVADSAEINVVIT